jgi:hypothetical protein
MRQFPTTQLDSSKFIIIQFWHIAIIQRAKFSYLWEISTNLFDQVLQMGANGASGQE